MEFLKKEQIPQTINNIRNELRNYIINNKLQSLIIGVSGGIDSALVCALARPVCDDLNVKLVGRSITIETNRQKEIDRAKEIGINYCHDFEEINLTDKYNAIKTIDDFEGGELLGHPFRIRMGNIKARLRMIYLYNIASIYKGMVLSTDNLTEYYLGFWTLHGDVGDYAMIQNLWKTEVYDISEFIVNNDENKKTSKSLLSCIKANATDGLGISNTDLDQIMPNWKNRHKNTRTGYNEVDKVLIDYLFGDKKMKVKKEHIAILERYNFSSFKRNLPVNIDRNILMK